MRCSRQAARDAKPNRENVPRDSRLYGTDARWHNTDIVNRHNRITLSGLTAVAADCGPSLYVPGGRSAKGRGR
jgi:hypothetical protein